MSCFGREAEIVEIMKKLKEFRLVSIYGDMGMGKASVVKQIGFFN